MSKTIKEMIEARARLVANAQSEFDSIGENTTDADRADINSRFEAIMTQADGLTAQIDQRNRLDAAAALAAEGDPRRPTGSGEQRGAQETPAATEYREAFHQMLQAGGDVHDVPAEVRSVLRNGAENFTREQRAQVAGVGAGGGFLVPEEMMRPLNIAIAAFGPMLDDDFATVINTVGGGTMPIPGVDDVDEEAAAEAAEGGDKGAGTDVAFTRKTLEDHMRTTGWLTVSVQLMTGSMTGVEGLLGSLLGERLGRRANRELTVGTGVDQAVGIVTGASLGKTAAGLGFTADEVLEFIHTVDPAYRAAPKFGLMFNDNTSLQFTKLKDGDGNYLLRTGADGVQSIVIGNTKTRYTINQAMPDIAAGARSMIAGDMGRYFVRKIGQTVIGTDRGKAFWPGFGIAGYQRFDGVVADPRAIKAFAHP